MEKNNNDLEDVAASQILALDIATKTGYYHVSDGGGVWNFTPTLKRNNRKTYKDFRDTLVAFVKQHDIKQIVAEDVNVRGHFVAMRKLSEFRGVLKEVCESLDINPPVFVNVSSIKREMTGDTHATKTKMIKYVKKRFGITPVDDNHADAISVYYYYSKNKKSLLKK